ncbi:Aspartate/tyrosine/aromatic aminotransferase [Geoglobus ahangari]|uniref:Aspartate/tyrosine/aromatic aminotransferase n=1 Tax=Geoglobus ahangari TaxID=113653 RepID=A0A0F7IF38_9EURY|nr:pyridoxal phosphate-dependent aminotransferase [Geoglobus ahangari]AKG91647.1 Aspartate/tyrosine/aromatic aminotransferase [Geoglobus ahangari]
MSRADLIQPSATMKISERARQLRREGKDVIDMGLGEPDFSTPPHIVEAACKALEEGKTTYAPAQGIPELREAIAEKVRNENGIPANPENVIVTAGAKYAIYEAMQAIIEPGDEVILLEPAWVSYEACVLLAGGKPVFVKHDETFKSAEIEEHITPKTKMVVVNSPNNPIGVVYPKEFLKKVADLASDHGFYVMADEVYEKIIFDGTHHSIASFDGMFERTITINAFSKTYAMTGWRLGYAVAEEEVIKRMRKIQSHSISSPTTFVQYAGIAALKGDQSFVERMVSEFRRRRDVLVKGLDDLGIEYAPPDGAFYVFMNTGMDSDEFSQRFLEEYYVAVTPGSGFGRSYGTWVRLSYATSVESIREMLERLEKFLERMA